MFRRCDEVNEPTFPARNFTLADRSNAFLTSSISSGHPQALETVNSHQVVSGCQRGLPRIPSPAPAQVLRQSDFDREFSVLLLLDLFLAGNAN